MVDSLETRGGAAGMDLDNSDAQREVDTADSSHL